MQRPPNLEKMGFKGLETLHQRKSLGQHVFENLKSGIIKGRIAAGSRIVESRLAEALGISRTPVREGLHKLEREGYVAKLPRGGFCVLGLSREDVEETFGIRGVLESYAARLAAEKHRRGELKALEDKIAAFQNCLDRGDLAALPGINTAFHDLLYALSRSPKLIKMISDLSDPIYRFRHLILQNRRLAQVSNADHRQMLALIRRRDAAGVEKLVRGHLRRGKAAALETYDAGRTVSVPAEE